ncbi:MAG: hypothetical protein O2865_03095 [Planctomycetota bacterium]|nr:hypothetical protein [Planctomycetota bacterium]MDA0933997.1 hypothetical protein [Planctomycetota bacterium]MDA1221260.1 hypothetical protein [Planctomycetota bacterium]
MTPTPLPARFLTALGVAALAAAAPSQQLLEDRLKALEAENRALAAKLEALSAESAGHSAAFEALASDLESLQLGDVLPDLGEGRYGLGPAASKVYGVQQGLSIGGYGEFLYEDQQGGRDRLDALRAILYFGYKFDDRWVLNTEIEIEHGSTSKSSGTTDSGGDVSFEFGYLDYLAGDALNARAGMVLIPVGFVNELHEPITFLGAQRPEVEKRIMPTTWRAPGAGVFGGFGGFSYRTYAVTALEGSRFDEDGLRSGRQKGNRTAAEDFAWTGRIDWTDTPGLVVGASFYWGDTGQDGIDASGLPVPDMNTTIVDLHVDWKSGPLWLRGLFATAWVDDTSRRNAVTPNATVASRQDGFYVEGGYDVMSFLAPESGHALYPFVRYEEVDTQAQVAPGSVRVVGKSDAIWTFGAHWRPIPQVVVKAEFQDFDDGQDRFDLLLGYIF